MWKDMVEKERKKNSATVDDSSAESKPWYRSSYVMIAMSAVVFAVLLSAQPRLPPLTVFPVGSTRLYSLFVFGLPVLTALHGCNKNFVSVTRFPCRVVHALLQAALYWQEGCLTVSWGGIGIAKVSVIDM